MQTWTATEKIENAAEPKRDCCHCLTYSKVRPFGGHGNDGVPLANAVEYPTKRRQSRATGESVPLQNGEGRDARDLESSCVQIAAESHDSSGSHATAGASHTPAHGVPGCDRSMIDQALNGYMYASSFLQLPRKDQKKG